MSSLTGIAKHLLDNGPRKIHPTSRRVRVLFNNTYIVDTTEAIHVWEHDYFPQYYVPQTALQNLTWDHKEDVGRSEEEHKNGASIISIVVPGPDGVSEKMTDRAIAFSPLQESGSPAVALAGLVRLEFNSMGKYK